MVELMDVGVMPSSNPYVWLRLNADGLRYVIEKRIAEDLNAEQWIEQNVLAARQGHAIRYLTSYVESITDGLDARYYREDEDLRSVKRDLGLRRASTQHESSQPELIPMPKRDVSVAVRHLGRVSRQANNPVLKSAANSLRAYLQ
jgi:hypothetical protein